MACISLQWEILNPLLGKSQGERQFAMRDYKFVLRRSKSDMIDSDFVVNESKFAVTPVSYGLANLVVHLIFNTVVDNFHMNINMYCDFLDQLFNGSTCISSQLVGLSIHCSGYWSDWFVALTHLIVTSIPELLVSSHWVHCFNLSCLMLIRRFIFSWLFESLSQIFVPQYRGWLKIVWACAILHSGRPGTCSASSC